jgi:acylphosphatase
MCTSERCIFLAMVVHVLHLLVSGKVQGVHFRKYTQQCAQSLSLRGIVRNLDDGSVEVIAFARDAPAALATLHEWCSTKGSPKSRIESCAVVARGEFELEQASPEQRAAFERFPFAVLK